MRIYGHLKLSPFLLLVFAAPAASAEEVDLPYPDGMPWRVCFEPGPGQEMDTSVAPGSGDLLVTAPIYDFGLTRPLYGHVTAGAQDGAGGDCDVILPDVDGA